MATVQEIYNEIDRIENAKSGIAGAIEEKGVEVPAGAKIEEYPGLVRQIQQGGGSSDAVLYTPQTLTEEQKAQARENIGAVGGKMGVISHDITYNVDGNVVISHTITNVVNGLIPQAFIDKWKAMGGTFIEGGYFAMNGINDLSYEDALAVDAAGILTTWTANSFAYFLMSQSGLITSDSAAGVIYKKVAPRTMYPLQISGIPANSGSVYFFMRFSPLEVLKAEASMNIRANTTNQYFCSNAKRLRRIENITFEIDLWTSQPTGLFNLVNIEYIQFTKLAYSMNLSSCPAFSAEAVAYMITNAGTATITITLHATAYARASADASVQAALQSKTNVSLASA